MLNQHALSAVAAARIHEDLSKPLYESYCFSQIPQLIRHLMAGEENLGLPGTVLGALPHTYDKVILFLLDGFGWRFFERYADRLPFLKRIVEGGVASKLTTQFPSTTAAHVTTLHTGLPVAESGIFEWWYYEPVLDRLFAPLLFSVRGGDRVKDLGPGIAPQLLFPTKTLYQELSRAGVKSYCFQHRGYAHSPFSRVVCQGAEKMPFRSLPEAMVNLTEAVKAEKGRAYFCVYLDVVDGLSHQYGPESRQVEAEIEALFALLENIVHTELQSGPGDTLLLITADHGQVAVSPGEAIYLDERVPSLKRWVRTTRDGLPLAPAGGPRDMFLYLHDEHLTEAQEALSDALKGRATVYRTSHLLSEGYFGPRPSEKLLGRLGELLVLAHSDQLIWWREHERFKMHHRGHHGALSAYEAETLLLAAAYGG